MPSLYIAPDVAGLPYTPYLTVAEYQGDPDALDTTTLVPGGSAQQNSDALFQKIVQASNWMNREVHYVLAATLDTETRKAHVRIDGSVRLPCRGFPIRELVTFKVGMRPSTLAALSSAANADIWSQDNVLEVPVNFSQTTGAVSAYGPGDQVYCQWQYVNGWANTLLNADAQAAATSIVVQNSLGIYPGMQLTLYDIGVTEVVTVASNYVGGYPSSTTVPIVGLGAGNGLQFLHTKGVSVSALPADIKKAAILATSGHIKTRGGGAMIMDSISGDRPEKEERAEAEGVEDLDLAREFLAPFALRYYG